MAEQLNLLPETLVGGETVSITVPQGARLTAAGWTLAYRFASPTPITASGVDDGAAGWTVSLSSAQTLTFPAGALRFDAIATKTVGESVTEVVAIDSGQIVVTPTPHLTSKWSTVLASVDAAIATWGTSDQRSMSIEGMSISYRSIDELLKLRSFCLQQIARETGNRRSRIVRTRFAL